MRMSVKLSRAAKTQLLAERPVPLLPSMTSTTEFWLLSSLGMISVTRFPVGPWFVLHQVLRQTYLLI